MAFATTNVVRNNLGSASEFAGEWSSSVGDAAGTVAIGGRVLEADFYENVSSGAYQPPKVPVSWSQSGSTTTVTVYHQGAVTTGYFSIKFKG